MNEAKFCVTIDGSAINVVNLNSEAVEVYEEFSKTFPGKNFMLFILLSESTMEMIKGELFYDVSLMDKDDIFNDLIDSL